MSNIRIFFNVAKRYDKKVREISEEKIKDRSFSSYICKAIIEKFEREHAEERIDTYAVRPETELDTAPRIYEPLTEDYLKQLSPKDVVRLRKMVYWNKKILDDYVASLEEREIMRRKYDGQTRKD